MKYFIKTFGCQQNVADSERVEQAFSARGFTKACGYSDANYVIINTCMVRESAEERVYGLVQNLAKIKSKKQQKKELFKIVVTGCMVGIAFRDKTGKFLSKIRERMPQVDEFMPIEEVGFDSEPVRQSLTHAWVPISNGCNNFCTFCIVPFTRGREISRPYEDIIEECLHLKARGYTSVMLLGQNVNSYGADLIMGKENIQVMRDIKDTYFDIQNTSPRMSAGYSSYKEETNPLLSSDNANDERYSSYKEETNPLLSSDNANDERYSSYKEENNPLLSSDNANDERYSSYKEENNPLLSSDNANDERYSSYKEENNPLLSRGVDSDISSEDGVFHNLSTIRTKFTYNGRAVEPIYVKHLGRHRIPTLFPYLLEDIARMDFEKVDFVSSNPWDFSTELVDVIAKYENITRTIHLPVQSGDNEVLKRMNRWYTREEYLNIVESLKSKVAGVKITTDIIVGFCGETNEEFQNTVKLAKEVGFEKAYISRYSERYMTAATKVMKNDVPPATKKKRWKKLDKLINTFAYPI